MEKTKLLIFAFILLSNAAFSQSAIYCAGFFGERTFPRLRHADAHGKSHFQFGLEMEYSVEETEKLFSVYMPSPELTGMTKTRWESMGHDEKLDFFSSEKIQNLLFGQNESGEQANRFIKLQGRPGYDYLPNEIKLDLVNFEIVAGPFESYQEWKMALNQMKKLIGVGSMQATVSLPAQTFFSPSDPVKSNLSMYKAFQEHDTIEKLHKGSIRHKKNPHIESAQSFVHPYLGPLDSIRETSLANFLEQNARGDFSDVEKIASIVKYHKFVAGTVYRPDLAHESKRIVSEIRDCHRDLDCLESRVQRLVKFYQQDGDLFNEATNFIPFNREESFKRLIEVTRDPNSTKKLSTPASTMLDDLYPNLMDFNQPSDRRMFDFFANFAFPYRDWSGHLKALSSTADSLGLDLAQSIYDAQELYTQRLKSIANDRFSRSITKEEAKVLTQAALVNFVTESKLYETIRHWLNGRLPH